MSPKHSTGANWGERLFDEMPTGLREEIDVFAHQIALRSQGKLEEHLFAETRLRRGVYGQRYDNGERHDGQKKSHLPYRYPAPPCNSFQ